MNKKIHALIFSVVLILSAQTVKATHVIGAEIRYNHLSGFTYSIEGVLNTELCAPADRPEIIMSVDGIIDTIPRTSIVDLMDLGCCGTRISGYQFQYTFPSSGIYTIVLTDMNRTGGIANLPGSINTPICVKALLIIHPMQGHNNSIRFETPMSMIGQSWNTITHDPGAVDLDGDSLTFEFITPEGTNCSPIPGYTFPETANYIHIDPETGAWIWDHPLAQGQYILAIRGTEWRNGVMVGQVTRDMMICLELYQVGMNETTSTSTFTISPTLTNGPVRITTDLTHPTAFQVFDSNGSIHMQGTLQPGDKVIDLTNASAGVYHIRVNDESVRVVKQ